MARSRRINPDLVAQARQVARQTQDLTVYRQAMAVLLPADLSASLEQTAQVLGVGRATVHRLQVQFRHQRPRGGPARKTWGGTPPRPAQSPSRRGLSQAVGHPSPNRRGVGRLAAPGGVGPAVGAARGGLGGVSFSGAARLAESGPRHAPPQGRPAGAGGLEKKLPEVLADLLKPEGVQGRSVRVMFQDEARFGRMVRLRRCWAPAPARPTVPNGYERRK
jgi:hypothetical protein